MSSRSQPLLPDLPDELIERVIIDSAKPLRTYDRDFSCKGVPKLCAVKKCTDQEWQNYLDEWYNLRAPRDNQAKHWFKTFCTKSNGTFYHMGPGGYERSVGPSDIHAGMIVVRNNLKRGGMKYDWEFFQLTRRSPRGRWSAKLLHKVKFNGQHNMVDHHFYKQYVRPGGEQVDKRARTLPDDLYVIWDPQYEDHEQYGLYDGGVHDGGLFI